jgi:hypothetical protein
MRVGILGSGLMGGKLERSSRGPDMKSCSAMRGATTILLTSPNRHFYYPSRGPDPPLGFVFPQRSVGRPLDR